MGPRSVMMQSVFGCCGFGRRVATVLSLFWKLWDFALQKNVRKIGNTVYVEEICGWDLFFWISFHRFRQDCVVSKTFKKFGIFRKDDGHMCQDILKWKNSLLLCLTGRDLVLPIWKRTLHGSISLLSKIVLSRSWMSNSWMGSCCTEVTEIFLYCANCVGEDSHTCPIFLIEKFVPTKIRHSQSACKRY